MLNWSSLDSPPGGSPCHSLVPVLTINRLVLKSTSPVCTSPSSARVDAGLRDAWPRACGVEEARGCFSGASHSGRAVCHREDPPPNPLVAPGPGRPQGGQRGPRRRLRSPNLPFSCKCPLFRELLELVSGSSYPSLPLMQPDKGHGVGGGVVLGTQRGGCWERPRATLGWPSSHSSALTPSGLPQVSPAPLHIRIDLECGYRKLTTP